MKSDTWIKRICANCGIEFLKEQSQCKPIKKSNRDKIYTGGKYCSRKCFWLFFKKNFKPTLGRTWKHTGEYKERLSVARKGDKNPMYVHGEYSGLKRRGKTQRQKIWRRKIFKRDGYICQICKKKGGDLEAHHIKLWAYDKSSRYLISNGVTLCVKHHKKIHEICTYIKKKVAVN